MFLQSLARAELVLISFNSSGQEWRRQNKTNSLYEMLSRTVVLRQSWGYGFWWDKVDVWRLCLKLMFNVEGSSSTRLTKVNYKLRV